LLAGFGARMKISTKYGAGGINPDFSDRSVRPLPALLELDHHDLSDTQIENNRSRQKRKPSDFKNQLEDTLGSRFRKI